ncbi:hypothetical protein DFS34DRAFT_458546 [Phlyctochytrium arcticum]|nr:hypothetical protein DFS34DRAFT_458546 [Phlyctochytrium arcticum]
MQAFLIRGSNSRAAVFCFLQQRTFVTKVTPEVQAQQLARRQLKALPKPSVSPPKHPRNAYILFDAATRGQIEVASADAQEKLRQQSVELGKRWKSLSSAEKAKYEDAAATAQRQYEQDYKKYLEQRTPTDILIEHKTYNLKKKIDPNHRASPKPTEDIARPLRPYTAYISFVKEVFAGTHLQQRELVGADISDLSQTEKVKAIAKAYHNLPSERRKRYESLAQSSRDEYKRKMAEYEAKIDLKSAQRTIRHALKAAEPKKKKALKRRVAKTKSRVGSPALARAVKTAGKVVRKAKKVTKTVLDSDPVKVVRKKVNDVIPSK